VTRYCIRRNPTSGRWIMYGLVGVRRHRSVKHQGPMAETPHYQIIGSADTMAHAIEAVYA
jgi:hypothetical protein